MTNYEEKELFGKNLTLLLQQKNLTQMDFARKLDIPKTTVNSWCSGKVIPRIDMLHKIENVLNINFAILLKPGFDKLQLEVELYEIIKDFNEDQFKHLNEIAKLVREGRL